MEFIQKKTADPAVEHFLFKAVDQEISLPWDRFEGQLPECGFCESGLSCRDCLQGPCISHPFRDQNKVGVCGKDKDLLAAQSLLRMVLKGTMGVLDQVNDFLDAVSRDQIEPQNKSLADEVIRDIYSLLHTGKAEALKSLPRAITDKWAAAGVAPRGIAHDVIKAAQKVEGGVAGAEETLLWTIKAALMGRMITVLGGKLNAAVFGNVAPTPVSVNMGVFDKDGVNILIYGPVSPVLKAKIAAKAADRNITVTGVCTDVLLPPYTFPAVTNFGSQEIPIMTGAVDLVVAADQYVNPSLADIAKNWKVKIVPANGLKIHDDLEAFAAAIVTQAQEAHDIRSDVTRDIPDNKETAMLGYCSETVDAGKIAAALGSGKIKGIAIFSGSNNVKYAQDNEFKTIVEEFLAEDVLCISDGEASIALAKYGFLNPEKETACGDGLKHLLASLGDTLPDVIDWPADDFIKALAGVEGKAVSEYPVCAYFAEASRSAEAAKAMAMAAMGVSVYFWPLLPVTGSTNVIGLLEDYCSEYFGGKINVVTAKIDARAKAALFLKAIDPTPPMSGKNWK